MSSPDHRGNATMVTEGSNFTSPMTTARHGQNTHRYNDVEASPDPFQMSPIKATREKKVRKVAHSRNFISSNKRVKTRKSLYLFIPLDVDVKQEMKEKREQRLSLSAQR